MVVTSATAEAAAETSASAETAVDRLPFGLCLSFGVGTVGVSILLNTVTTYLPALMATVLGRSTAVAGLLLTASKLYDVAADLTIGVASDRTRSPWGRRRPYLLAGAVVAPVSFLMLFAPPALPGAALLAYLAAGLVIYSTGYSLFNVPYLAMPAEMTTGYHERTRLLSFRTFAAAVGQILASAGAAWLIQAGGGAQPGYRLMGIVLALAVLATSLWSFLGTARAATVERAPPSGLGALRQIALLAQNRPLLLLMTAKFLQFLSLACLTSTMLLFRLNVLKIGYQGQVELTLVQNLVTAASMPFWLWLGRRIGKKWAYVAAIALNALTALSWLTTGAGVSHSGVDLRAAGLGFSSGGMLLMSIAMLPDTMEYDWRRTGLRREGVFSSFYAIVEKVGYAVGPAIVGVYLAHAGYVATTRGRLVQQPPGAVHALYMTNTVLPAALLALSIVAILGYRLDERALARHPAP